MAPEPQDRASSHEDAATVAVIIVNFNGGALLEKCVASLRRQTFTGFRTIIVDNASSDGSVDRLEERYPGTEIIRLEDNLGFAEGNNVGIEAAGSCVWVACLNPDAFPEPDWLIRMLDAAAAHPQYTFFGCCMLQAAQPDRVDGTGDVYHVSGLAWRRDHSRRIEQATMQPGEIFGPCAAAALYRRADLVAVGGFDNSYFCYFEDIDLAFRLRLAGHRCLYVPEARVHHVGSAITGAQSDFTIYHGHRNLVWTYFRNMPSVLLWCYLPLHVAVNLIAVLVFTMRGQTRTILRAKWHALRGMRRIWAERQELQRTRSISAWALRSVMTRGMTALYQQWRKS